MRSNLDHSPTHFSLETVNFVMEQEEASEAVLVGLSECFELGRALRSGDADLFCELYDAIVPTGTAGANFQFTVRFFLTPQRYLLRPCMRCAF